MKNKKYNAWMLKGKEHVAYFPHTKGGKSFCKIALESVPELEDAEMMEVMQINNDMIDGIIRERIQ